MKRTLTSLTLPLLLAACSTPPTEQAVTTSTTTTETVTITPAPGTTTDPASTSTDQAAAPATEDGCLKLAYPLPISYKGDPLNTLCNGYYTAGYSELDQLTRVTAEQLTPNMLEGETSRTDDFREDDRLHSTLRPTLDDYAGSGFDRGHLAPAADFKFSPTAMSQSFLLSNVAPQNPELNQGPWAGLESATRACARETAEPGGLTVLTGTLGDTGKLKDGHVTIPAAFFKLWYAKDKNDYRLWVLPNTSLPKMSGAEYRKYEVPLHQFREFWSDFPGAPTQLAEQQYGTLCPGVMPLKQ